MPRRGMWGLAAAALIGFVWPAGGCGSSDSGNDVKIDRGKDETLQNAMGNYMNKQPKPGAQK